MVSPAAARAARNAVPKVATVGTVVGDFNLKRAQIGERLGKNVPPGMLELRLPRSMPKVRVEEYAAWVAAGLVRSGGQGNVLPVTQRLGVATHAIGCIGADVRGNVDPQSKFCQEMADLHNVGHSFNVIRGALGGTTFIIQDSTVQGRPGILYGPGANWRTHLARVEQELQRVHPTVVHILYQTLLGAAFDRALPSYLRRWGHEYGWIRSCDTHSILKADSRSNPHKRLQDILPHLDIFFCSLDEAKLIWRAFGWSERAIPPDGDAQREREFAQMFLESLYAGYAHSGMQYRPVFGVTQKEQIWFKSGAAPAQRIGMRVRRGLHLGGRRGGPGGRSGLRHALQKRAPHGRLLRGHGGHALGQPCGPRLGLPPRCGGVVMQGAGFARRITCLPRGLRGGERIRLWIARRARGRVAFLRRVAFVGRVARLRGIGWIRRARR